MNPEESLFGIDSEIDLMIRRWIVIEGLKEYNILMKK